VRTTTTTATAGTTDLVVTKSATPGSVAVGGRIFYRITVRNNGPVDATAVAVQDDLPAGVTVTRTNPSCGGSATRKSCGLGTIPAGQSAVVQIDVIANTRGSKTNSAFALGRQVDPNMNNNSASVTTNVTQTTLERGAEAFGFESELHLTQPPSGATGYIVLNDAAMLQVRSGPPVTLRSGAEPGTQHFEARLEAGSEASGNWRFSFGGSRRLVSGSLRVESGEVLSLSGDAVVFAVRPLAAPIRFSLELE
jgi:uncharacterized repeat protein (TIGR01451 family)